MVSDVEPTATPAKKSRRLTAYSAAVASAGAPRVAAAAAGATGPREPRSDIESAPGWKAVVEHGTAAMAAASRSCELLGIFACGMGAGSC